MPYNQRSNQLSWVLASTLFTLLDYFLWDYVKSLVYADKSETNDAFEENNWRLIADIRLHLLQKVVEN